MIYDENCSCPKECLEQLMRRGLEGLPDLVREIINEAMQCCSQAGGLDGGQSPGRIHGLLISENPSTAFADFQPVEAAQPGDQTQEKNGENVS